MFSLSFCDILWISGSSLSLFSCVGEWGEDVKSLVHGRKITSRYMWDASIYPLCANPNLRYYEIYLRDIEIVSKISYPGTWGYSMNWMYRDESLNISQGCYQEEVSTEYVHSTHTKIIKYQNKKESEIDLLLFLFHTHPFFETPLPNG